MPHFGIGDEGVSLMVFLSCKLFVQFVLGTRTFFGLAYLFRLNPMGEYARMAMVALDGRFPKMARVIERRFES